MSTPTQRIVIILGALWIGCELLTFSKGSHFGTSFLLIPLGAIVGPFMGLSYPYSIGFKFWYSIILALSFGSIVIGIHKRAIIGGQIATVLGVIGWCACGLLGLSTGT